MLSVAKAGIDASLLTRSSIEWKEAYISSEISDRFFKTSTRINAIFNNNKDDMWTERDLELLPKRIKFRHSRDVSILCEMKINYLH